MGLSLEFYAGNAEIISNAFTDVEFEDLHDGTRAAAYADLSLHLMPTDLDILSDIVAQHLGVDTVLLNDSLIEEVGSLDEGETGGADLVTPDWVAMIASLEEKDAGALANVWMAGVAHAAGISPQITEHATEALASLIGLCKKAIDGGLDVVHVWYL